MPVKLKSGSSPQDAMSISLSEYQQGRANFISHYYLTACSQVFGGQDLEIPWNSLSAVVNTYINNCGNSEVGIRMVYCFDNPTNALYLRIQICTMAEMQAIPGTFALVTNNALWFKVMGGKMTVTTDTTLYNADYLNKFYYCANPPCTGANVTQLSSDIQAQLFARTITFPWTEEIKQMYLDNGSPANAKLCFGATSYVHPNSGQAPIAFPHGLVLYLKNSAGQPFLNNDEDSVVVFHNKGADYGTLCPPKCDVYVLPQNIQ